MQTGIQKLVLESAMQDADELRRIRLERDAWYRWSVEVAMLLNVPCEGFRSESVAGQCKELREKITEKLTLKANPTPPPP
jgi:hypothetical protein